MTQQQIDLLITEHEFECAGCGGKERGFWRSDKLPIELSDYSEFKKRRVREYQFHNLKCLRRFLNAQTA